MTWSFTRDDTSDVQTEGGFLNAESVSRLESLLDEITVNYYGILKFLGSLIARRV